MKTASAHLMVGIFALVVAAQAARAQDPAELGPAIIHALEFSPDGKTLAAATGGESSGGGPVVLWSVAVGAKEWKSRVLTVEPAGCSSVAFSPDGKRLAYGDWKDKAVVVEVESGEVVQRMQLAYPVPGVAFSPDGSTLATACHNKSAYLWDVESGEELRRFEGHEDRVNSVDISPDGTLLLTSSNDRTVKLWDLASGTEVYTSPPGGTFGAEFSADGKLFASAGGDGYTRVRETESRKLVFFPRTPGNAARFSPDGDWLAVAVYGSEAKVFRMEMRAPTGTELRRIDELIDVFYGDDYAKREAASAELAKFGLVAEQRLEEAAASKDAEVRIRGREALRRARSPEPDQSLGGLDGRVQSLAFSPDGKLLAVGSRGGDVKVWSVPGFEVVAHLQPANSDRNPTRRQVMDEQKTPR